MALINETDAISEILKIKAELDQNLMELQDERTSVKQKIKEIREAKESIRKEKCRDFQKQYQLKIEFADVQKDIDTLVRSVNQARSMLKQTEESIWSTVGLTSYADSIKNIRSSIEGAINFYSDDSLRLELLRQTDINREKRVELTRLTNELEMKQKEFEEAKKERERQEELALEREKQEQERKKKLAEEKIQAEKEKQREEFLKQKLIPLDNSVITSRLMPFRAISINANSPEAESRPSLPSSASLSSLSGHELESISVFTNMQAKQINGLPSLSQLTRW